MKRVLILAIGCNQPPWDVMAATSQSTWDSEIVDGCETIYYFGNPVKPNTEKEIYFPIKEDYLTMGKKMLKAFGWALDNKAFDFIARVNSSCYVNKKSLIKAIQDMPNKNLFAGGIVAESENTPAWCWGGLQFILSRDVVAKIVDNAHLYDHSTMEDVSLSHLVAKLGIPFTSGKGCSIDKVCNTWRCVGYGSDSFDFVAWEDIKKASGHYFFRCKYDSDRTVDKFIMEQLHKYLT